MKIENKDKEQMNTQLTGILQLLGPNWREAFLQKDQMQLSLISLLGFASEKECLQTISKETAIVTVVAGSAKRWKKALLDISPQELEKKFPGIDINAPRTLAPVINLLPALLKGESVPIGVYPMLAGRDLGQQIIIYRNYKDQIENTIIKPLGIKADFIEQHLHVGHNEPLGHGDAALQLRNKLAEYKYVIFRFGSDANSRQTLLITLLVLAVAHKYQLPITGVLPTANMDQAMYPVEINEQGIPLSMKHPKLKSDLQNPISGPSNVSVFGFCIAGLIPILSEFEDYYQQYKSYVGINNGTNELALDNIMERVMRDGTARQLCVSYPGEITGNVKVPGQIDQFIEVMKKDILPQNKLYKF